MKYIFPLALVLCTPLFSEEIPALPTAHQTRKLEGWNVRVDERLFTPENKALGDRAMKVLDARLIAITAVVPAKAVAELQKVTIQVDQTHGKLSSMQYHPGAEWLKQNGYKEELAKCVHVPRADDLLNRAENHRMPWVILHELAHAYHDQVLGFEEERILAAWKKFCASGKYESVLTNSGQMRKHYALTDQKEFFAEMTEAYLGSNDFYPFVAGELKQVEPEIYALMESIWGKI